HRPARALLHDGGQPGQFDGQPRAVGGRLCAAGKCRRPGPDDFLFHCRGRACLGFLALAGVGALEQAVQNRAMKDETPDIKTGEAAGPLSRTPESGAEPAAPRKKRSRASAKAATAALEARIGHKFADANLLATAFTHVSALKSSRKRGDSYQRLEVLGDHVLGLIVSDMLYRAFPGADEGELSKRLADLVRKESCADVAKSLGLLDDIKLGAVGAGAGARLRKSVLGDVCEAVIGAIFLDGGYATAAEFVERNW